MRFGYFDDEAREYVITTPHTPRPWINYLGTESFFSLVSGSQGGYSFYRDAKLRRLTRYRYNGVPADDNGRYLFIHDGTDVWSPSYAPCRVELDEYECRHGLGYTTVTGARNGVRVVRTTCVPRGADAEISRVVVTNLSTATKTLQLFTFVEFCLWDALDDQMNYQRNLSLAEVEIEGSAIYHKTEYRERRNHYAVFWVNKPIAGFDTDRDTFIGPERPLSAAVVPATGRAANSVVSGWYPIGSHQVDLTLAPGESTSFIVGLGYVENPTDKWEQGGPRGQGKWLPLWQGETPRVNKVPAHALMARFATDDQFDVALAELRSYFSDRLAHCTVRSADPRFDRTVNVWNPYQCLVTFNLSRSASYFETGIGRGMGFRDSNQDLLGIVGREPARARERILDLAATQFPDGSAYHQFQPLTKRGNHDLGTGFNDDPLWLVVGVSEYVKETGDWAILDEPVPYDNDPALAAPLLDHLVASYRHVSANLGPHGLPLIGRADWNDCLNLNCFSTEPGESFQTTQSQGDGQTAESVFIAGLFCLAIPDLAHLLRVAGRAELAVETDAAVAAMRGRVETAGWDGAWFRRAYDAFGGPVGSAHNDEGQIYIEPQGMCVMGGAGLESGQARQALESVESRLTSQYGIAILAPAYTRYHLELGEISSYPPGYKENGGIFCHNNPWVIIAETMAGSRDRALSLFQRITGSYRADDAVYGLEPYVYAQMVAGPDAVRYGEAKNSWLTGTAAWCYYAATAWLLGVRAGFDGLIIEPGLPASFGNYEVTRQYRGATYHIAVENPGGAGTLTVDGEPWAGPVLAAPGTTVEARWAGRTS